MHQMYIPDPFGAPGLRLGLGPRIGLGLGPGAASRHARRKSPPPPKENPVPFSGAATRRRH